MATTDPTPTNIAIATGATALAAPTAVSDFRTVVNAFMTAAQLKAQTTAAFLEQVTAGIGNGALSGGAISAGSGLSVSVAALTALVGTYVNVTTATVVGSLANGALNYIYLYQDGTFTSNTSGTLPSSAGGHGQAMQWGTATTAGGVVTAVAQTRDWFRLAGAIGTATAVAGAATLDANRGKVTSEALTTAAGSDYVLTLTNNRVTAASVVVASVDNGTNSVEGLSVQRVTPAAGSVVIRVRNTHSSSALNGSIKVSFAVL